LDTDLALIGALREQITMTPEPLTHYDCERAKELLSENGLSYEDVARILGASVHSISAWMRGVSAPGPQYADSYQKLLSLLARRADVLTGRLRERLDALLVAVGKEAA
jgi:transcriptional regulator with XRE-family HTH domain